MQWTGDRRKAVGLCTRCRQVYAVWVRTDGRVYPISSHNTCSCDEGKLCVLGDA